MSYRLIASSRNTTTHLFSAIEKHLSLNAFGVGTDIFYEGTYCEQVMCGEGVGGERRET